MSLDVLIISECLFLHIRQSDVLFMNSSILVIQGTDRET